MARMVPAPKRAVLALALSALVFAVPFGAAAAGASESRVIVAFKAGAGALVRAEIARQGGRVALDLDEVNAVAVHLSPAAIAALKKSANVEFVEPDGEMHVLGMRSKALGAAAGTETVPYGITMVQADQLPDTYAADRKLCIVDSGYTLTHEDLAGNSADGFNFTTSGTWDSDEASHGTHVGGTISAVGGNGVGVVGVMPNKHIHLYIAKVFDASGSTSSSTVAKAALRCGLVGSNVISMSLGGSSASKLQERVFAKLDAMGVLSIAAAGNLGDTSISYPAGFPTVMSVAAVDQNMAWATFSQYNADVEISGPGVNVLSTVPAYSQLGASTTVGSSSYVVQPMAGSPLQSATGPLADFGLGDTPSPGTMTGKVCLISRGSIAFADKVLNCQTSGGIGAIIYNNTTGDLFGTLGTTVTTIPSVGALQTDGAVMLGQVGQSATVAVQHTPDLYAYYSGTSMATPHVSAVAALVWSYFPKCSAASIRNALNASALDIGDPGFDNKTGNGLVQAKAAYDYLKTNGCAAN